MPVSEATYLQLVLEDCDETWELICGRLRSKPPMTQAHGDVMTELAFSLRAQLDPAAFRVRTNHARARLASGDHFVPDVAVISAALAGPSKDNQRKLDSYEAPLPLVAEVWSPSTGDYDVTTKVPGYMARGDLEIWELHPYDATLRAWRRQADGTYTEHAFTHADTVEPVSLPGVRVRLGAVFQL